MSIRYSPAVDAQQLRGAGRHFSFCGTIEMSGLATFSPEQVISSVGEVCVIAFTHRRRSFVCIQNLADDGTTLSVARYDQPFCKAVQDLKV